MSEWEKGLIGLIQIFQQAEAGGIPINFDPLKVYFAGVVQSEKLALLERIESNMPYRMESIALREVRKIKKELEAELS